jgi:Predicted ATP-dependent endonuclease of the OLD family
MIIKGVHIQNYRSLKNVRFENLGQLTILIGINSSGKSNLLEAISLFFNEFDTAPERNIGAVNDYIWFDRDFKTPIIFEVTLECTGVELKKIVPEEILKNLAVEKINAIVVKREITGTPQAASWSTKNIIVNGKPILKDGSYVIIQDKQNNTKETTPNTPSPQLIGTILSNFSRELKGKFKVVYATRNYIGGPSRFGDRVSFIQPDIISELTQVGNNIDKTQQEIWNRVESEVKEISENIEDIRIMGGQVAVTEIKNHEKFPVALVGGGNQEIITLSYQLSKESGIIGLEEPEIHLHPKIARQLFYSLKKMSSQKQIFIATHSTVFVDSDNLSNTWIVKREQKETIVNQIHEKTELKDVLTELGIKPSDIFFSNYIIFVEGQTEKVILPILAEKLSIDFKSSGAGIISINGKSSGRYRLHVWNDAAKDAQIPYFLILDKVSEHEVKQLKGELKRNKNLFILSKPAIEDYYPLEYIVKALDVEYKIKLPLEEAKEKFVSPRDKSIEKYLVEKVKDPIGWKIRLGENIAKSITSDEIDDELKSVIERIATELKLN